MNRRHRVVPLLLSWTLALALAGSAWSGSAFAQATATATAELAQPLAQMGDSKWSARSKGFYRLLKIGADTGDAGPARVASLLRMNPQKADEIKVVLTKALAIENRLVASAASLPETHTDYYGDLIAAVASLNDPRSADALAGALGTGNMVNSALAGLGDAAVDPVLRRLQPGADQSVRVSACHVLQDLADPAARVPVKDAHHKQRIVQALASPPCAAPKKD